MHPPRPILRVTLIAGLALGGMFSLAGKAAATVACPPGGCTGDGSTTTTFYSNAFNFGPSNADELSVYVTQTTNPSAATYWTYSLTLFSPSSTSPVTAAIPLTSPSIFTSETLETDPTGANNVSTTVAPSVSPVAATPYAGIFGSAYPYVFTFSDSGSYAFNDTALFSTTAVLTTTATPVEGLYGADDQTGTIATFDPPVPGGVPLPEPGTLALIGVGLALTAARRLRAP